MIHAHQQKNAQKNLNFWSNGVIPWAIIILLFFLCMVVGVDVRVISDGPTELSRNKELKKSKRSIKKTIHQRSWRSIIN